MSIPNDALLEISVTGLNTGGQAMNVWQYQVGNTAAPITAENVAEAWWNNVKVKYRQVATTYYDALFRSVMVRELNEPAGAYGSYAIPTAEQGGTRSMGTSPQGLPPFCCVGVRLNVGTRVTRPGQKRFPGLLEIDQDNGLLASGVVSAALDTANYMIQTLTLGAPALAMTLSPIIVRKDAQGTVTAYQPIRSASVGLYVTTQNSRKFGRGM